MRWCGEQSDSHEVSSDGDNLEHAEAFILESHYNLANVTSIFMLTSSVVKLC